MEKFCFYLHHFNNKSNGIVITWEAAHQFSQLGYDVKVVTYGDERFSTPLPAKFNGLLDRVYEGDEIVIYPDSVVDNPLHASKVSRFLLAKPYILDGRQIQFAPNDFVFSYSKAVIDKPPYLTLVNPELLELKEKYAVKKENQVLLYFGKVRFGALDIRSLKSLINSFESCRILTRTQPAEVSELYAELARSSLLISFDPLTNLCLEATLLDTPVLISDPIFKTQYDDFNFKNHGFFYSPEGYQLAKKDVLKANQELKTHFSRQPEIVKSLAREMLAHFKSSPNNSNQEFLNYVNSTSKTFYEDSWNRFPIFNVLNFDFLLVYLAFCDWLNTYLFLRVFYRAIVRPIRWFKKVFCFASKPKKTGSFLSGKKYSAKTLQEKACLQLILRKK